MPMQPRPIADTTGPPLPNLRCFILILCSHGALSPCAPTERGGYSSISYLSDPRPRSAFLPALANRLKSRLVERTCFQKSGVLFPAIRILCADNRRVHAGNAQGKSQCDGNS